MPSRRSAANGLNCWPWCAGWKLWNSPRASRSLRPANTSARGLSYGLARLARKRLELGASWPNGADQEPRSLAAVGSGLGVSSGAMPHGGDGGNAERHATERHPAEGGYDDRATAEARSRSCNDAAYRRPTRLADCGSQSRRIWNRVIAFFRNLKARWSELEPPVGRWRIS